MNVSSGLAIAPSLPNCRTKREDPRRYFLFIELGTSRCQYASDFGGVRCSDVSSLMVLGVAVDVVSEEVVCLTAGWDAWKWSRGAI